MPSKQFYTSNLITLTPLCIYLFSITTIAFNFLPVCSCRAVNHKIINRNFSTLYATEILLPTL